MQTFANGKRRFLSFVEFYVIKLKVQEVKFDHSTTLSLWMSPFCDQVTL